MPHPHATLSLLAALALGAPAMAQADDSLQAFGKLGKAAQQEVLSNLADTTPDSPLVRALRAASAAANAPQTERTAHRTIRHGKKTISFAAEPRALPVRVVYAFGVGTIEPLGAGDKSSKPEKVEKAERSGKPAKGGKPGKEAAEPAAEPAEPTPTIEADLVDLQQALLGCLPGSDRALAALQQQLDGDLRGDAYAAFLHSWRNGQETFYEALDRTAGTKDSVFFFDAMLDDFRGQFGGGHGDAKLQGGLQAAHDALQDAFLAYRQYRGFREAVAWSLVLPPDLPLPLRLRRYEEAPTGSYSLRQQVVMVAAAMDHDLAAFCKAIAESAPALPEPIWGGGYDPYPAWNALFRGKLDAMIDRAGSSDTFLQQAQDERRDLAAKVAAAAQQAIAAATAHR